MDPGAGKLELAILVACVDIEEGLRLWSEIWNIEGDEIESGCWGYELAGVHC